MAHHYTSYPAGELFAQAPVKEYPGIAVETVSDSSRYFVLRIQDDNGEDVTIEMLFCILNLVSTALNINCVQSWRI